MGGSPKKGTELFTKLTSDGETVSYSDINDKNHVLDVFGECYWQEGLSHCSSYILQRGVLDAPKWRIKLKNPPLYLKKLPLKM